MRRSLVFSILILGCAAYVSVALAKSKAVVPDAGFYKVHSSQGELLGNSELELPKSRRKVNVLLEVQFNCEVPTGIAISFATPRPTLHHPTGPPLDLRRGKFFVKGSWSTAHLSGELSGKFTSTTKAMGVAKFNYIDPAGTICPSGKISFTASHR